MKLLRKFLCLGASRDGSTVSAYRQPRGYQQIVALNLAAATKITIPANANGNTVGYAVVQCAGTAGTDSVRWRDDGVAPTSTVGMVLGAGQELDYSGDVSQIQFIIGAGSTAILNISLYA